MASATATFGKSVKRASGARYCAAKNCSSNSARSIDPRTQKLVRFHKFPDPVKERERCLEWIVNLRRPDIGLSSIKKMSVCSLHFEPRMYNCPTDTASTRLLPSAVPRLLKTNKKSKKETDSTKSFRFETKEAATATTFSGVDEIAEVQQMFVDYCPRNIYMIDETSLFYRFLPTNPIMSAYDVYLEENVPKDRITLLIGTSICGSDKLPVLAIGKYESPKSFLNIKTLPVIYKRNKNAYMTGIIFEEWLRKLDRKFTQEGRRVALVLENCTTHLQLTGLVSIKLVFISAETNHWLRPRYNGVITHFKITYRTKLLQLYLQSILKTAPGEEAKILASGKAYGDFPLSLLKSLSMVSASWNEIRAETIARCCRTTLTTGHHSESDLTRSSALVHRSSSPYTDTSTAEMQELTRLFKRLADITRLETNAEAFIHVDDNAKTTEEVQPNELVSSHEPDMEYEESSEDDDEETQQNTNIAISKGVANKALDVLRVFLQQHEDTSTASQHLDTVQHFINNLRENSTERQTLIHHFFSPNKG